MHIYIYTYIYIDVCMYVHMPHVYFSKYFVFLRMHPFPSLSLYIYMLSYVYICTFVCARISVHRSHITRIRTSIMSTNHRRKGPFENLSNTSKHDSIATPRSCCTPSSKYSLYTCAHTFVRTYRHNGVCGSL